ncbi:MAG: energy transducer TonB [Crocinitomicaceae bacterium]|nr:energy transducer TonB [Crocinitomicaceae bacterium]
MKAKKNTRINLEKRKKYFFQIGLVLSLSFVLVAFEWAQFEERDPWDCQLPIEMGEEVEIIPIAYQKALPPPPPSPPSNLAIMNLVDDIENNVEDLEDFESEEVDEEEIVLKEIVEEVEIIDEEPIYVPFPEHDATYRGGLSELYRFLHKNLNYPAEAKRKKIEGKVYCEFVVMEDGSIGDVVLRNRIGGGCDEEALRVIKLMPGWNPARQGERKVRTSRVIPINFQIN